MSTSRALRIFRYFVHPGLSLIPLFRSYRSRGKRFPLGPCQLRLRRLIAVSISSSPAFLPTSRYQWDATPPDLGPANDMVRRIPYSRLTSLFFNAGRSIGDKIALADAASRRPFMGTSVA